MAPAPSYIVMPSGATSALRAGFPTGLQSPYPEGNAPRVSELSRSSGLERPRHFWVAFHGFVRSDTARG